MINDFNYDRLNEEWNEAKPYRHVIIDNFFKEKVALKIASEFPDITSDKGVLYNNPIEIKKAVGDWNHFSKYTYQAFQYMCSHEFLSKVEQITGIEGLISDYGLHGGGYHMHSRGGK